MLLLDREPFKRPPPYQSLTGSGSDHEPVPVGKPWSHDRGKKYQYNITLPAGNWHKSWKLHTDCLEIASNSENVQGLLNNLGYIFHSYKFSLNSQFSIQILWDNFVAEKIISRHIYTDEARICCWDHTKVSNFAETNCWTCCYNLTPSELQRLLTPQTEINTTVRKSACNGGFLIENTFLFRILRMQRGVSSQA